MTTPRFLAENFYDPTQFGDATVTANEQSTRHEAFRVGTNRRSPDNFWTPTTSNQDAWVEVALSEPRSADTLVIDRGHNLSGSEVKVQASDDNFATTETIATKTIPSQSAPASNLTDGARTRDGAWAIAFDTRIATYWRLLVSAMGAGKKPEIRGLYLGRSWQPDLYLEKPFGFGDHELQFQEMQGPDVWTASSRVARRRSRQIPLKLASDAELDAARDHTEGIFWRGSPMWLWIDPEQAEKAWLAKAGIGQHGWQISQGWGFFQTVLQCIEHEPLQP